jgi:hypothetical protein
MMVIGILVVMVLVMMLYDVYSFVFVLVPIICLSVQPVDVEKIVVVAQVPRTVVSTDLVAVVWLSPLCVLLLLPQLPGKAAVIALEYFLA